MINKLRPLAPPANWVAACSNTESTLHQLSPYIGKLKSSIARDLILNFTKEGELIIDPFAGSGTIPLEASLNNRQVFATDISPYAVQLTKAKLFAPISEQRALEEADITLKMAASIPKKSLPAVPPWVSNFFHPKTLQECLRFSEACRRTSHHFLFACFLGILHHQRPGFLSYPSSHLVPYHRTQKFPPQKFPEMYQYRPLKPRLLAKIQRAYRRRPAKSHPCKAVVLETPMEKAVFPTDFDCLITSPPYMNALDYGRDNRLRLWFIDPSNQFESPREPTRNRDSFKQIIEILAQRVQSHLRVSGHAVLIIGEKIHREKVGHPADDVRVIMQEKAPSLTLSYWFADQIPDIRRCRRSFSGTKTEHILVYERASE